MELAIDHDRGRKGAIAEAVDRLEGDLAIGGGGAVFDGEARPQTVEQRFAAHRLAGFGAADLEDMPARRRLAEVLIEVDDANDLGAGEVEGLGDDGDAARIDIAEFVEESVEDWEEGAGHVLVFANEMEGAGVIPG